MGIGAMMAATTKLPLTSVLIACLLMLSDAVPVTPLVIVAVVIAYVAVAHIEPRLAGSEHASSGPQADIPAEA
jgi:H+/Cl- antiporter ClcA